ncbi:MULTISPECIES: hypothetical protein [Paenibacillus]|uniref:hypothetical protein n=1 Tax=Paenibacillus TaxID=44249 RepID=UPI0011A642FE|nr:hypothetical protein [Paenibacillus sp. Y412MC10]
MLTIKNWQDVFDLNSAKTTTKSLVEHVEGLTICASWPFWIRLCLEAKKRAQANFNHFHKHARSLTGRMFVFLIKGSFVGS